MKITVRDQILTGNIGHGWADTYAAAKGWAKYYGAKLTEFINNEYPDGCAGEENNQQKKH